MSSFLGGAFGGGEIDLSGIGGGLSSKYLGYGSVSVLFPDKWYHIDSNGDFVTDDHGNRIFLGFPGYPFLDHYNEPIEDSNGDLFIQTNHAPHGLGGYKSPYLLDSNGKIMLDTQADEFPYYENPLLEPDWRKLLVDGVATPLDTLEIAIQYVTIQPRFTNLGKIRVFNSTVRNDKGLYLYPNSPPLQIIIDDLRKIYIIGNAGEWVDFIYGTNEDIYLTTPADEFVTTPGGDEIG